MTTPQRATDRPIVAAQIVFGVLLLLKVYMAATMPPVGDEAYYWMWGQKLDWSYFDHPPLHAWLLGLMSRLFGWNLFALRALTWLTLAGTLWIFWLWSKRLKPDDPAAWFWPTAAVYLASPMFFLMGSIAFHDHLLIFLCLASAHCFLVFAEHWETSGKGWRWLYLAALLLGLAALTKYNAILLALGLAIFLVAHPPARPLWRSPHLYLAAVLSLAVQAPVIWWNVARHFASYEYHLVERWNDVPFEPGPLSLLRFVGLTVSHLSPLLLPPIVLLIRRPLGEPFADRARTLALSVLAISCAITLAMSLFVQVLFYWNIVAFVLLMPLLVGWMNRRWMLNVHFGYGIAAILFMLFDMTMVPVANLTGQYDWTFSSMRGWPEVAARIAVLEQNEHTSFVATTRYTTAAQLGFAMHDPEVTDLSSRHDQYGIWFDAAAHDGQDALVVSDPILGLAEVAPRFDSLTPLETVPYTAFGQTIYAPTIYLGRHFPAEAKAK